MMKVAKRKKRTKKNARQNEREKERDIESLSLVEILVPCWSQSQSQIRSQSRWVNGMVHVQCAYVQV